jgi:hypothetical protein
MENFRSLRSTPGAQAGAIAASAYGNLLGSRRGQLKDTCLNTILLGPAALLLAILAGCATLDPPAPTLASFPAAALVGPQPSNAPFLLIRSLPDGVKYVVPRPDPGNFFPVRCWRVMELRFNCDHVSGDKVTLADMQGGPWGMPGSPSPGFLIVPGTLPGKRPPLDAWKKAVAAHFQATHCAGMLSVLIPHFCPEAPGAAQASVAAATATGASTTPPATSSVPYPATNTGGQAAVATAQPSAQVGPSGDTCSVLADLGSGHQILICGGQIRDNPGTPAASGSPTATASPGSPAGPASPTAHLSQPF